MRSIQTNTMIFMSDRLSVAFSFSRRGPAIGRFFFFPKGALTHHLQSRRWYPSRWSGSCALHELSFRQFSRGGRQCRKRTFPVQSALYLLYQQNDEVAYCHPHLAACLRKPATGSFYAVMGIAFSATPIFSFQKRNRKKGR